MGKKDFFSDVVVYGKSHDFRVEEFAEPTLKEIMKYPDFRQRLKDDKPFIREFSKKHPFVGVGATIENGDYEPAYFFEDSIGFYTIGGIKKSLARRVKINAQ